METKYDVSFGLKKEVDIDGEGNEVFFVKIAAAWKCDFYGRLGYEFFWKKFGKTLRSLDFAILHAQCSFPYQN